MVFKPRRISAKRAEGHPVLTAEEFQTVMGGIDRELYSGEEIKKLREEATFKLSMFQKDRANRGYIDAVNQLIPIAEKVAKAGVKRGDGSFDRLYHGEMNRLKRQHGLLS